MKSGELIIDQNPHLTFDKLKSKGYEIFYQFESEEDLLDLYVVVKQGEQVIGRANFSDDGPNAHCQNVYVETDYRHQRIATTIYVFAEKAFGKELFNFWDGDPFQTDAAKFLWKMPDRPFGSRDESTH